MLSCGCSVRMAPHAGHSTALMAVRGRRSAARSITPTKAHRVGGPDAGRAPTGSRRGAWCPARFLVGFGDGAMGEGTVEETGGAAVSHADEVGAGVASPPLAGRRGRGARRPSPCSRRQRCSRRPSVALSFCSPSTASSAICSHCEIERACSCTRSRVRVSPPSLWFDMIRGFLPAFGDMTL